MRVGSWHLLILLVESLGSPPAWDLPGPTAESWIPPLEIEGKMTVLRYFILLYDMFMVLCDISNHRLKVILHLVVS